MGTGFFLAVLLNGLLIVRGLDGDPEDLKDCITTTEHDGKYLLCVGTPKTAQVGGNTSFYMFIAKNPNFNSFDMDSDFHLDDTYLLQEENVTALLTVSLEQEWLADIDLENNTVEVYDGSKVNISMTSLRAGRTEIIFNCSNGDFNSSSCPFTQEYLKLVTREVSFAHSLPLNIVIIMVGWIYFAAWSISFYPQIFLNFYRRSVVGLNFDFLALNITGFLAYSAFNVGLFWIPEIKRGYFLRHPSGVNPVLLNDVIFSLHAAAATAFTIFQCFIFKRGGQRVSYTGMVVLSLMVLTLVVCLFVSVGGKLAWLDFLYAASYVKLAITLVKYIPQAWFNCRRRSTVGWSIGNVLLDFTGGNFSILQMFLLSYNYDDWKSIFGDPTKFGLGLVSIMFDLFFMLQHYVLFRNPPDPERGYKKIENSSVQDDTEEVMEGGRVGDEESPLLNSRKGMKGGNCKFQKLMRFYRLA